jgi:hypothetical protein
MIYKRINYKAKSYSAFIRVVNDTWSEFLCYSIEGLFETPFFKLHTRSENLNEVGKISVNELFVCITCSNIHNNEPILILLMNLQELPNGLRYLRWGGRRNAVQLEKC